MSRTSTQNLEIKIMTLKTKTVNLQQPTRNSPLASLTKYLTQRNTVIDWIYRAQKACSFSRSSLFLAIALLDKLLIKGMPLSESNCQLTAGTLTLLVTKFNEVYPVTVRKLQAISAHCINAEKYIETQGFFLEKLAFNLTPDDRIYENLAELEFKLGENSESIIKTAVVNPDVSFKLGEAALIAAIESMRNGGLTERRNESRLSMETAQLKLQLQRLRSCSPANKRLVSPQRA